MTKRVYISRHVIFDESSFPFASLMSQASPSSSKHPPLAIQPITIQIQGASRLAAPQNGSILGPHPSTLSTGSLAYNESSTQNANRSVPAQMDSLQPSSNDLPIARVHDSSDPTPHHHMITRSKDGTRKPKVFLSIKHPIDPIEFSSYQETEPTCFTTANKDPKWRQAMCDEFNALLRNGTWCLVPIQPNMNVIGCKWVY